MGGWRNVFPSNTTELDALSLGKILAQNQLGEELMNYLNENGQETGGLVDADELMKKFKCQQLNEKTPIVRGYKVSDDTLVISLNMLRYEEGSTGTFDVPPLDIFFSADFFMWRREGKVIKSIYECPIEKMNEDRPLLAAVRELSVWNYPNERIQFKNGSLEVKKVDF